MIADCELRTKTQSDAGLAIIHATIKHILREDEGKEVAGPKGLATSILRGRLSAGFHGLRRCAQRHRNLHSDRRSQPGTWIPPRTCRIGSVVARSDAIEITVGVLIKQWVNKAYGLSNALIDERDQSSPERSHGTGASDYVRLPSHQSNVAGVW